MNPFRIAGRAYRDCYDNVYSLFLATLVWWLSALTVVFLPAGTLLLFHVADQRHGTVSDRPNMAQALRFLLASVGRGWLLALCTFPIVGLTIFNLLFYGGNSGLLSVLAPVWLVLLLSGLAWTFIVFAVGGVERRPVKETLRLSAWVLLARLPQALVVLFLNVLVPLFLLSLIAQIALPLVLLVPTVAATAFSRFALTALRIPIPDPYAVTDERREEQATR